MLLDREFFCVLTRLDRFKQLRQVKEVFAFIPELRLDAIDREGMNLFDWQLFTENGGEIQVRRVVMLLIRPRDFLITQLFEPWTKLRDHFALRRHFPIKILEPVADVLHASTLVDA